MKKLLPFILIGICLACSRPTDESNQEEFKFSYSSDTVMVDAGDDFIYLRRALGIADLSKDEKQLYNFNFDATELEVIDLEQMKLVERIKMEKEGPLGTGFPRYLSISDDGKFFFVGYTDIREFDPSLQNLVLYQFRSDKPIGLEEGETLGQEFQISQNGQYILVQYGPENMDEPKTGIAILTLNDMTVKKIPMDLWQRTQDYLVTLYIDGKLQSRSFEQVDILPRKEQVLISSHNFNEVYVLDLKTDSISHKTYHSQITADTKKLPAKTTLDAPEQMRDAFTQMNEDVEFGGFYFDEVNEKFFRFSRELDRKIGDSTVFKEVVTIFDKDLNQVHEEIFPINYFGLKFFKEGKLYSFLNIDDELGFAVFTFDF